jgi:hypothetical protein
MRHTAVIAALLLAWAPPTVMADKIYRHVDKDGKVYYSEIRPTEPANELKIAPAPADLGGTDPGACLSYECYAEQLKKDRLEREKGYAEMRRREEREAMQRQSGTGGAGDEYYRSLCRNSQANMDCTDTKKIREQMDAQQQQYDRWRSDPRNHGQPATGPTVGIP